jgi:hypothetical protein
LRVVIWVVSSLLVVLLLASCVQLYRYLRTRRDVVADRQSLLHSPSAFHVATIVMLSPDQELLAAMRAFVDATEGAGGEVIYAGKVAANGLVSRQIPQQEWDAFLLAQFPSRAAYDEAAAGTGYQSARVSFAASYALGMQRWPFVNFALPVGLLGIRIRDVITLKPSGYPFEPAQARADALPDALARRDHVVAGLLANKEYGAEAVVVLNFIKAGNAEERAANADYGFEMLRLMAEMGNGPMHLGKAVTLEGDADFDNVVIVYYPGVEYFAEMLQSQFFTGIVGDKQLGDSLASLTVPLLPQL